jgi:hypothetical protein
MLQLHDFDFAAARFFASLPLLRHGPPRANYAALLSGVPALVEAHGRHYAEVGKRLLPAP